MNLNPVTIFRRLQELRAKYIILKRAGIQIHKSSRVKYTKILSRPPLKLKIGHGSLIECEIISERVDTFVTIGNNTFIGNSKIICATAVHIGDDVLISWGCTIVDHHSHSTAWDERKTDVSDWRDGEKNWQFVRNAPVNIKDKVWIGFNSIILAGVTVGEGAVVGCGSVVTKDVPAYSVVAGCPARIVKKL